MPYSEWQRHFLAIVKRHTERKRWRRLCSDSRTLCEIFPGIVYRVGLDEPVKWIFNSTVHPSQGLQRRTDNGKGLFDRPADCGKTGPE